uniref:Uncharacterized protein n=1 Tax=Cynoglossus semilaevis TaxID=244447 RepID=A0A3P8UNB9_CYNSE
GILCSQPTLTYQIISTYVLQLVSLRGTLQWRCTSRCCCQAAAASSWTAGRVAPPRRSLSSPTASP